MQPPQCLIFQTDYITHNMNFQSGVGVQNQGGALYIRLPKGNIVYTARCNIVDAKHHIVFDEVKTSFCVRKRNDVDLKVK